jgi:hypothetical protein
MTSPLSTDRRQRCRAIILCVPTEHSGYPKYFTFFEFKVHILIPPFALSLYFHDDFIWTLISFGALGFNSPNFNR